MVCAPGERTGCGFWMGWCCTQLGVFRGSLAQQTTGPRLDSRRMVEVGTLSVCAAMTGKLGGHERCNTCRLAGQKPVATAHHACVRKSEHEQQRPSHPAMLSESSTR